MAETEPRPVPRLFGAEHVRRYLATGGAEGQAWNGVQTLILTTTGRRSGEPRLTPLIYGQDGTAYVVVASKGGAPEHPDWYLNLLAQDQCQVQVGPVVSAVRARVAQGEERAQLWHLMAQIWPAYDEYSAKTVREIPVVVLDLV
ncbi:MAG: nitroreductase family deazaflavin-dependent oxidoreductase [Candidatus Dormibacteria bacterium]